MDTNLITKSKVANYCRILGVYATDDILTIKLARNRLAKIFHPDKNINSSRQNKYYREKFKLIQQAYEYLTKNHGEINKLFAYLEEYTLTYKGNLGNKSHWVYKAVSRFAD